MSNEWKVQIAESAKADPKRQFTTLAHRLTPELLKEAFQSLNSSSSPGPDGLTMEEYAKDLDVRIADLHKRLVSKTYKAAPARRVYIPKPNGKLRPLGIANVEDRTVQKAVAMVLELIYEQDFLDFSYGFRPNRNAHGALEALRKTVDSGRVQWIFEADIKGFFDNLDHAWLRKFLEHRVTDGGIHRLIGKVLNAGYVENGKVVRSEKGTPQGGPLSPLLANLYLHYVLDLWFERKFRRTCRGAVEMVRYADDFVVCFAYQEEAERFSREVEERFSAFGLDLVPEKTRKIAFGTEQWAGKPGPKSEAKTFTFLGFTHYMKQRPKRGKRLVRKPCQKKRRQFLAEAHMWLKKHMHTPPKEQQLLLSQKLRGFYEYFYLRCCRQALVHVKRHLTRLWYQALGRRSQRGKRSWEWFLRKPWTQLPEPGERKRARAATGGRQENEEAKMRESIASVQLPLFPNPA